LQGEKDASQPRKTVCLVDDEVDIATVINRSLTQDGYIVHEFNDPNEAWEYFKTNGTNCTVVISDIRMYGMNGFDFCRRIKQLRPETPVILMTAFETNLSEFSKVMPHTTPDGLMTKPISLIKLKEFIKEITSKAK